MKKLVPFIVAILVIAGGAAVYFGTKKDSNNLSSTSKSSSSEPAKKTQSASAKKACDVLTLADAKTVLGATAEAGSSNTEPATESDDLSVSTCTYSDGSSSLGQSKTASVLVRSPKTDKGTDSNKAQFSSQKPAGAQDVSGYGDAAFWNQAFGQLNVLKNGNWYIISNGPLKASDRSVDQAKQLADLISQRL